MALAMLLSAPRAMSPSPSPSPAPYDRLQAHGFCKKFSGRLDARAFTWPKWCFEASDEDTCQSWYVSYPAKKGAALCNWDNGACGQLSSAFSCDRFLQEKEQDASPSPAPASPSPAPSDAPDSTATAAAPTAGRTSAGLGEHMTIGDRMEAASLALDLESGWRKVVMVTLLADNYAHLHDQLMCSLKRLNLSSHMVIVTNNETACEPLLPEWRPQCFQSHLKEVFTEARYTSRSWLDVDRDALNRSRELPSANGLVAPYDYGSAGFRRVAQMKPLLSKVAHDRGLDVLFVDGDIIFNANPLEELYARRSDLVVQDDSNGAWVSSCKKESKTRNVNSGFYLLRATEGGSQIIDKWLASIDSNPNLGAGDQIHLNAVLWATCDSPDASSFTYTVLLHDTYPNGFSFYHMKRRHNGYRLTKVQRIVHFNYIKGIPEKLERIQKEGLKFRGRSACREPEAVLALEREPEKATPKGAGKGAGRGGRAKSHKRGGSGSNGGHVNHGPHLPCDNPPYVMDAVQYYREGVGSAIWPHSTSIIFADAINAPWIDMPYRAMKPAALTAQADPEPKTGRGGCDRYVSKLQGTPDSWCEMYCAPDEGCPDEVRGVCKCADDVRQTADQEKPRKPRRFQRANAKHPVIEPLMPVPEATASEASIVNAHDRNDYAEFFGFRDPESRCDYYSLQSRIKNGELQLVEDTVPMYDDQKSHHWNMHDHSISPALKSLCKAIADGTAPPSWAMLAKNTSKNAVFHFQLLGDHRFAGVTDCLYNPRFRSRYHAARAARLNEWEALNDRLPFGVARRPADELWLSVHYRAGDVGLGPEKNAYAKKDRGDLAGLASYMKAVLAWLETDPERLKGRARGLKPVVHLFSEGKPSDFQRFTSRLPDAVLHLADCDGLAYCRGNTTQHDIDLITQSHMLIGGTSTCAPN